LLDQANLGVIQCTHFHVSDKSGGSSQKLHLSIDAIRKNQMSGTYERSIRAASPREESSKHTAILTRSV